MTPVRTICHRGSTGFVQLWINNTYMFWYMNRQKNHHLTVLTNLKHSLVSSSSVPYVASFSWLSIFCSTSVFSNVYLTLCDDINLSKLFYIVFCPFSFGHCVHCPSIDEFWLPLWFKLFLIHKKNNIFQIAERNVD